MAVIEETEDHQTEEPRPSPSDGASTADGRGGRAEDDGDGFETASEGEVEEVDVEDRASEPPLKVETYEDAMSDEQLKQT
ncbi:hypothetical protein QJS10_CPB18g00489 [Acorus calamus]|uniref:Uncharacterized protein n=1 Tax=Acorus calamus TaxID=4465 RepID=A0AAV9CNS1_ACOCL|nr:hypothetical protein QJS10_CPB18g00489 [Acorus calamus]